MQKNFRQIIQEAFVVGDLTSGLNELVSRIRQEVFADACCIFLIDEEYGEYVLFATSGYEPAAVGKVRIPRGLGLIGLIGEREELVHIEEASLHPSYAPIPGFDDAKPIGKADGYKGFLGVPIIYQGELLGVLVVQKHEPAVFLEEQSAFLMTLSAQLAEEMAQAHAQGLLQNLVQRKRKKPQSVLLQGVSGSPGIGVGQALVVYPPADLDAVPDRTATDIEKEYELFESALNAAREEVQKLQSQARSVLSEAEQALFDVYLRILDSRSLMNEVVVEIEGGQWAQGALRRVIKRHILHFESLDDPYLKERAADFRDLGRRILSHLQENRRYLPVYSKNTILVSEEVTTAALLEVPEGCLLGIVSGSGSGHSHAAIITRALGIPAVMGATGLPILELDKKELIVDGYNGHVYVSPSGALKKEFQILVREEKQLDEELSELKDLPTETQDGHRVKLYVNTGLVADRELSRRVEAEGVGLYRTELLFMLRDRFPSEEEQRVMYRQLLSMFAPRPVIMRTLDIGGDKVLSYFNVDEENPFLGWRGIRVSLDHPEIFLQQIRAMMHASVGLNNLSLMLPMISAVSEVESALRFIWQAYDELRAEGVEVRMPGIGLMIEVPAAVYQAYELAKRVDFLSVGSNDLTQYLLAVDRNNPRVAKYYHGLHPAVLRAMQQVVKSGHKADRPVTICGELASDPLAVLLLIAMDFDALSMSARSVPRIKWLIRQFTIKRAKELLAEVLKMDDVVEVRCHLELVLEEAGLAALIRAGR